MLVGVGFSEDVPLPTQRRLAAEVESAGLDSLWTNESGGRDALLVCQAWAAATQRLSLGTAVVPLWTRSPAQLAAGAATLQEATGGRFLLGVGTSHAVTMQRWHGVAYHSPLTAARETLAILRTLLSGGTTDHAGEVVSSRGLSLRISPTPPVPPLLLAAMGPRMLEAAGSDADGAVLNWASPQEVGRAAAAVRAAAADGARPTVAAYVRVAVDPDRRAARDALVRELAAYCRLPYYRRHLRHQGLGDVVEALGDAGGRGGGTVDDGTLRRLGWWGTPDGDLGGGLAAYEAAGLDHLIARVVTVGTDPVASLRHALTALAPAPR